MRKSSELSTNSIAALRSLLGRTVHTLFAPPMDAAGAHLAAWKLSMLLAKDDFLTFECDWDETPAFMLDSWQIKVERRSQPLSIEIDSSGALHSCSTIKIYGATPIRAIEVYRFSASHEDKEICEAVEYDGALVFRCVSNCQFAVWCSLNGPGGATYLHFSEDDTIINDLIASGTLKQALA